MAGYGEAADRYFKAGWSPLPLPDGAKSPPPVGWTGASAPYPSGADVAAWAEAQPEANIGLRLPAGVLGIDVDAYDGRAGAATLARLVHVAGPLPLTPRSTSRDDGISGIYLFRVPVGWTVGGSPGAGIDLLHAGHRYAVVWPSRHPEGRSYVWRSSSGEQTDPPGVDELPELPTAWLDLLAGPERIRSTSTSGVTPWVVQRSRWDLALVETGRHDTLLGYAGHLAERVVAGVLPEFEAVELVESLARRCVPDAEKSAGTLLAEARRALRDSLGYERGRRRAGVSQVGAPTLDPGLRVTQGQEWRMTDATGVTFEHVVTVWGGFLVVGALNLLLGEEGSGKSLLAVNLVAMGARGELSPDGRPMVSAVVGTEDSIASVWAPRLLAAGYPEPGQVFFEPMAVDPNTGEPAPAELYRPERLVSFLAMLASRYGPSLVYLDHLSAVVPAGADTLRYDDAGGVLRAVSKAAERYGHAVLGAWHFNKGEGSVRSRVMNSAGILASVRSAVALVERAEDHVRIVALVKSATGDLDVPARGFVIRPTVVEWQGRSFPTAGIGPISEMSHEGTGRDYVEEVMRSNAARHRRGPEDDRPSKKPDVWLREYLGLHGPTAKQVVIAYAEAEGYAVRATERAAARVGVVSSRVSAGSPERHVLWSLPVVTYGD